MPTSPLFQSTRLESIKNKFIKPYGHYIDTENCDNGDYIYGSKNIYYGFDVASCNDGGYMFDCFQNEDCWDILTSVNMKECYETKDSANCYNSNYVDYSARCTDSSYLYSCSDLDSCFGCVGLSNKRHHILNRPYSEEDYKNVSKFRIVRFI